jgi:tRNA(Ile2) C34 agmatinyltransferase TiaS
MSEICHRCGIEMEDDGEWFRCPCCRCSTRGRERQQARHQALMEELGMNEEEYSAHCRSRIDTTPPSEKLMKHMEEWAKRQAEEWVPACEHDKNPWGKS